MLHKKSTSERGEKWIRRSSTNPAHRAKTRLAGHMLFVDNFAEFLLEEYALRYYATKYFLRFYVLEPKTPQKYCFFATYANKRGFFYKKCPNSIRTE